MWLMSFTKDFVGERSKSVYNTARSAVLHLFRMYDDFPKPQDEWEHKLQGYYKALRHTVARQTQAGAAPIQESCRSICALFVSCP